MKVVLWTEDEQTAKWTLASLQSRGIRGLIKRDNSPPFDKVPMYKVYQTTKIEHDESSLPIWAQNELRRLRLKCREVK